MRGPTKDGRLYFTSDRWLAHDGNVWIGIKQSGADTLPSPKVSGWRR